MLTHSAKALVIITVIKGYRICIKKNAYQFNELIGIFSLYNTNTLDLK